MKVLLSCVALAAIVNTTPEARADPNSANSIIPGCRMFLSTVPNTVSAFHEVGICVGMVRGLIFADAQICPPEGTRVSQIVRLVVQKVDLIPERHNEPFLQLASEALRRVWPCR